MAWAMEQFEVPKGATVLDPYMGSGTTAIACIRLAAISLVSNGMPATTKRLWRESPVSWTVNFYENNIEFCGEMRFGLLLDESEFVGAI